MSLDRRVTRPTIRAVRAPREYVDMRVFRPARLRQIAERTVRPTGEFSAAHLVYVRADMLLDARQKATQGDHEAKKLLRDRDVWQIPRTVFNAAMR